MANQQGEIFYTVEDISGILRIRRETVRLNMANGSIPAVKIGRRWYSPRAAFDAKFGLAAAQSMSGADIGVE